MLCDVLHGEEPPIVLTGAIRPSRAPGADGPANLLDAADPLLSSCLSPGPLPPRPALNLGPDLKCVLRDHVAQRAGTTAITSLITATW